MAVVGPVAGVNAGSTLGWEAKRASPGILAQFHVRFLLLQLQHKECLTQTTKQFVAQNYQHLKTKEIQLKTQKDIMYDSVTCV